MEKYYSLKSKIDIVIETSLDFFQDLEEETKEQAPIVQQNEDLESDSEPDEILEPLGAGDEDIDEEMGSLGGEEVRDELEDELDEVEKFADQSGDEVEEPSSDDE